MAYSTREILLALCIRDSRVHGNGTLHPVLELAARETPLRLSPEDTVVLRWIHQQGGWSTLIEDNIPGSRRFSWTLFLAGLTLSLLVICSYLFISRGRH
ncbi:apoptosis regulator BHRF1 [human gammaherpesvirus 4]|uniref:Apoptosis regulator BHRF1 n=1 Tax=Epstein-Barr virus (strain GD1) TaxID=10376 RepID=A0A0B6VHH4_EBVG|nr:apoptosis regulator BHRF1 [human gammaherpesvirus 4]